MVNVIKNSLSMAQVVERYGYTPNRSKFIKCPFHNEKTSSLKIYPKSFYCFGCGKGGSVIDFVMKHFNLDFIEASEKLNYDFGLGLDFKKPSYSDMAKYKERERFKKWLMDAEDTLRQYRRTLGLAKEVFAPTTQITELWHPMYIEALKNYDTVDYYIDCLDENPVEFYTNYRKVVRKIADTGTI